MQRKYVLFTCLIIIAVILSACKTSTTAPVVATEATVVVSPTETIAPTTHTVATLTWLQEFDTLNPLYTSMLYSSMTQQLWNSWAWEFNDKSVPFPKLVTEIPSVDNGGISADGKTITMTLRSDIAWSDGTPLTSVDFKFTQEMAVSPQNAVYSAYPYDQIESIDTPDDQTVVIQFSEPFAPWLAQLWHGILPAHILQPVFDAEGTIDNAEWNLAPTVGLGPFVFNKWESGSYANFVKNEKYWGEPAKIDEIFFRFVPDNAAQVASLQAGDADLGYWFEWSDAPKLKEAGFEIIVVPNGYNEGIFFQVNNTDSEYNGKVIGNPAMLDVKVRQAIAMALDRESFNKNLNLGFTTVPASFWDSEPFYNNPPVQNYPYDPEAAKALLDEAGWKDSNGDGVRDKDGIELVLTYGTTNLERRKNAQVVFQENLAAVGIKVNLMSMESDLFFASYDKGGPASTGQVDLQEWSDMPYFPDPDIYYWKCDEIPTAEYPSGTNSFFLCDQELDALIKLQSTQVNVDERQQTISKINQIFHDKVYWLGLWQDPDPWAVGPRLHNVKFSPVNPLYNIAEWTITP